MLSRQEPTDYILEKAATGERITPAEALALYDTGDFLRIADTAREIRDRRLDPDRRHLHDVPSRQLHHFLQRRLLVLQLLRAARIARVA